MADRTVKIDNTLIVVDDNDYIGKKIIARNDYYEGNYLRDVRERYINLLNVNDCILDIGANIGNHSLFFNNYFGMKVYAFEPFPDNFSFLKENTKYRNDIVINNYGFSSRKEQLTFDTKSKDNLGTARLSDSGVSCSFKKLDDLKFKEKIGLIKIDVEGMEAFVLMGGIKTLKKHRPIILIEAFSLIKGINEYGQELFPIGYRLKHVEPTKENTFMLEFV